MTKPMPPRPEGVHPDARWEPENDGWEWVHGALDEDGQRHGPYREWHRDGYLHGSCTYVHGLIDGPNENYHPDGKIASIGHWKMGVQHGGDFFRAECESPEPWPSVGDAVWKISEVSSDDGSQIITFRYYDRDGNTIGMDGEPLPPLPDGLPDTARWFPQHDFWVDGATLRGTATQVGIWKWWSREGELQREEERRGDGTLISKLEYEDGSLDKKSIYDEHEVRRDHWSYRDDGSLFVRRKKNADGKKTLEEWYEKDGTTIDESTETEWDADLIVGRKQLGTGGVLLFEATHDGDKLACTLHHESGKPSAKGALAHYEGDWVLSGTWTFFDEAGEVELELDVPHPIEAQPDGERLPWKLNALVFDALEPKMPPVPQLAASAKIDWANVGSCYGNTEDFHRYLRGLVSKNARVRRYAVGSIYSESLHQGSVYECTARVMPFVIDLMAHPDADASELLEMVHDFATNAAPYAGEAREFRAEREANAPPAGVQAPDDDEDDWTIGVLGTVEAIGEHWSKLWKLMDSDDEAMRRTVLSLASLPEPNDEIRGALRELASSPEESPQMRAVAVEASACIASAPTDLLEYFNDESPLVHATAAIQCGLMFGPGCPDEVVDALAMALEKRDAVAPDYHELPFVDVHYLSHLALAVGSIGSQGNDKARALTVPLCERIEDVDGASAPLLGRGLLALVLGQGERPFGKDFMRVLETLATSKKFNAFNVNASEVLRMWNLPGFDLADLVEQLKKADDPEAALHAHMHE